MCNKQFFSVTFLTYNKLRKLRKNSTIQNEILKLSTIKHCTLEQQVSAYQISRYNSRTFREHSKYKVLFTTTKERSLTESPGLQPEVVEFFLNLGTQICMELFSLGGPAQPYSSLRSLLLKLMLFVLLTLTSILQVCDAIWNKPSSKFLLLLYWRLKCKQSHHDGIFFYET